VEPRLFYDGHCSLCHWAVEFVVRRDRGQPPVRFAPLAGETFRRLVPPERRHSLPDSVVLLTPGGELLLRSEATRYLMRRAGPFWRLLAALSGVLPRRLRDTLYDFVARRRQRWFGRTEELCPVLPAGLAERFDP
jgi:predicted DCC family thiol-disulfide oxidoreductase YuxK